MLTQNKLPLGHQRLPQCKKPHERSPHTRHTASRAVSSPQGPARADFGGFRFGAAPTASRISSDTNSKTLYMLDVINGVIQYSKLVSSLATQCPSLPPPPLGAPAPPRGQGRSSTLGKCCQLVRPHYATQTEATPRLPTSRHA